MALGTTARDQAEVIWDEVFFASSSAKDIAMVQNQGLDVDNKYAPAPEDNQNIADNNRDGIV